MKTKRKTPSTICKTCGKEVRVRPAGEDWIAYAIRPIAHKNEAGKDCDGRYREIKTEDLIEP